jgi:hypothetical protein
MRQQIARWLKALLWVAPFGIAVLVPRAWAEDGQQDSASEVRQTTSEVTANAVLILVGLHCYREVTANAVEPGA